MRVEMDPHKDQWSQYVVEHPDGHILQTYEWGELKSRFGWSARRVGLYDRERLAAGAQVLLRRLPGGWRLAYIPKGPLIDWGDAESGQRLFGALDRVCRAQRAFALKIEPDLPESPALAAHLAKHGFRPSSQAIQPRRTLLVDLRGDPDQILGRMKSKTRYNIRLSSRKQVNVLVADGEGIETFNRLMAVTGERDEFGVHSPAYYAAAYDILAAANMARLFIATYDGQPLAGILACACGKKSWYMYGASGNEHRDRMPTYALQWAAMRWAKSRGCTSYDLWGVPDEDMDVLEAQFAERHDGLWGVYRNKRGYGGELMRYAGAFDRVYSALLYRLYHLALRLLGRKGSSEAQ